MTQLFPYQIKGAQWLAKVGRGLLADSPGLGKTAQAIVAAQQVMGSALDMALVICPASVVENWKREILRFAPALAGQITVLSYDKARARDDLRGHDLAVLILDEAHYLKTKDSKRTQAVFGKKCDGVGGLVENAKYVFLLTGTPMPNAPNELWPMLRATAPETIIGKKSGKPVAYWTFVERYCKTVDNGFGLQITGGRNLAELKQRIAPFVLRRRKDEVMKDLPPIQFDILPLSGAGASPMMSSDEALLIQKTLAEGGVDALRAIAPHVATYRRAIGIAKVPAMAGWAREQIEGGLKKLVLFAQHRDVIDMLSDALGGPPHVVVLDGRTTDRQAVVDHFQNSQQCQYFIGQIQAAGTGITLTAASDLVFVESSWVPTDNEQAAMRIHRIGQQNACTVRFATIAGSIDEQIQRACARKLEDIRSLFA